jgi:uncharacterized protein YbaR (Trm112 family)
VLDPQLLEILACPACHGTLTQEENELVCTACARRYPIRDGIPVLLVDAPEEVSADGEATADTAGLADLSGEQGGLLLRLAVIATLVLVGIGAALLVRRRSASA